MSPAHIRRYDERRRAGRQGGVSSHNLGGRSSPHLRHEPIVYSCVFPQLRHSSPRLIIDVAVGIITQVISSTTIEGYVLQQVAIVRTFDWLLEKLVAAAHSFRNIMRLMTREREKV